MEYHDNGVDDLNEANGGWQWWQHGKKDANTKEDKDARKMRERGILKFK